MHLLFFVLGPNNPKSRHSVSATYSADLLPSSSSPLITPQQRFHRNLSIQRLSLIATLFAATAFAQNNGYHHTSTVMHHPHVTNYTHITMYNSFNRDIATVTVTASCELYLTTTSPGQQPFPTMVSPPINCYEHQASDNSLMRHV
jgi:hypothetical protein